MFYHCFNDSCSQVLFEDYSGSNDKCPECGAQGHMTRSGTVRFTPPAELLVTGGMSREETIIYEQISNALHLFDFFFRTGGNTVEFCNDEGFDIVTDALAKQFSIEQIDNAFAVIRAISRMQAVQAC